MHSAQRRRIYRAFNTAKGLRRGSGPLTAAMREAVGCQWAAARRIDHDIAILLAAVEQLCDEGHDGANDLLSRVRLIVSGLEVRAPSYVFDEKEWAAARRKISRPIDVLANLEGENILMSIKRRSNAALELRQNAVAGVDGLLDSSLVSSALRSALGRAVISNRELFHASTTVRSLRRCADQASGEIDGVPLFGTASGNNVSVRLSRGGTSAATEIHRVAAEANMGSMGYVGLKGFEYELAHAWTKLSAKEPAFRRLCGRVFPDGDGVEPIDVIVQRVLDFDVLSIGERVREFWTSDYDDLIEEASAGRQRAFVAMARLRDRMTRLEHQLEPKYQLLDMLSSFTRALGVGEKVESRQHLSARDADVIASRRAFAELLNDPETDISFLWAFGAAEFHGLPRGTTVLTWIRQQPVFAEAVARFDETAGDYPEWSAHVWSDLTLPSVGGLEETDDMDVDDVDDVDDLEQDLANAETDAFACEERANDDGSRRLLDFVDAMRDAVSKDPLFALQLDALMGRSLKVLPAGDRPGRPGRRRPGYLHLAETPLDGLIAWTFTEASQDDVLADIMGVAYRGKAVDSLNLDHSMAREVFTYSPEMLRADLGYLQGLADESAERTFGVDQLLDSMQIELIDAIDLDPSRSLERRLAHMVAESKLETSSIETLARSGVAPQLIARMIEDRLRVPQSFHRALEEMDVAFPAQSRKAVSRLTKYVEQLDIRLVEETDRLIEVETVFTESLARSGRSVAGRISRLMQSGSDLASALDEARDAKRTRQMLRTLDHSKRSDAATTAEDSHDIPLHVAVTGSEDLVDRLESVTEARRRIVEAVKSVDRGDVGTFTGTFLAVHSETRDAPDAMLTRELGGARYAQRSVNGRQLADPSRRDLSSHEPGGVVHRRRRQGQLSLDAGSTSHRYSERDAPSLLGKDGIGHDSPTTDRTDGPQEARRPPSVSDNDLPEQNGHGSIEM